MAVPELKKIGKYEVEGVIGRGGMGIVFKASDPTLGRSVAIKMMTASYADDPDLLKRFYREAQFTGKLHHANIVTVYDLGDLDGNPYFVMEYLEGESLDSVIASGREVSMIRKLAYIVQVCAGLEYAHAQGVIHRDIKPANVMVMKDDSVKIVDFGIARVGNDRLTRPRQVMGSYHYMAPEQVNDKEIDSRTDLFSTGVVLYQLVTSHLPFDARDTISTLMKLLNEPAPPLSTYISHYPPELDGIIERALQKSQEDRYQSAEEFSYDLLQVSERLKQEAASALLSQAENLAEAGDLVAARGEALQALKLDRNNSRAHALIRRIQQITVERQRTAQALALLRSAESDLAEGNFDHALASLKQAHELDSKNEDVLKMSERARRQKESADRHRECVRRAAAEHNAGRLEEAEKAIHEALSLKPDAPHALALAQEISRDLDERRRRQELQNLITQAREHIGKEDYERALQVLSDARQIDATSAVVEQITSQARKGLEEQHRRAQIEQCLSEIHDLVRRAEHTSALQALTQAIGAFPGEPRLLQLREETQAQLEKAERVAWVEKQKQAASSLADAGQTADARDVLRSALDRYPDEEALASLLSSVQQRIEHEAAQQRRADCIRRSQEALGRRAYPDAVEILRSAHVEFPDDEIARMLDSAIAGQESENKITAALGKAKELDGAEQFDDAVGVLQSALREHDDSRLHELLRVVRERQSAFKEEVREVLTNARHLLEREQADEAIAMLRTQPTAFTREAEFRSVMEEAREIQSRVRAIEHAKTHVFRLLAEGDLKGAASSLDEARAELGTRVEFEQLGHEIEAEHRRLRAHELETQIARAEAQVRSGRYYASLQILEGAAALTSGVPEPLRSRYESAREAAEAGIARVRLEAEERERKRIDAERLEQERLRRERLEHEALERAEREKQERERLERERRERERLEQERQKRERIEAEQLARERAEAERAALQAKRERARIEANLASEGQRVQQRPTLPGAGQVQGGNQSAPMSRRKPPEPSVAELTPPEGLNLPSALPWVQEPTAPVDLSSGDSSAIPTPPAETSGIVQVAVEPSARTRRFRFSLAAIAGISVLALIATSVYLLERPGSPAVLSVRVSTSPDGAHIRVEQQACVSPCSVNLASGQYVVEAELSGYERQTKAITVSKTSRSVSLTLVPEPPPSPTPPTSAGQTGTLTVRANVDGARVLIDNHEYGKTSGGLLSVPLAPKGYEVSVRREGYGPSAKKRVLIQKGSEANLLFELEPTAPAVSKQTEPDKKTPSPGETGAAQTAESVPPPPPAPQQKTAPEFPAPSPAPKPADDGSQLWASVANSKDRSGLVDFRNRFPNSRHAEEAEKKIEELDWESARDKNDPAAIQAFLSRYPNSSYSELARQRVKTLQSSISTERDRQAILSILNQLQTAYNSRDVDQLARLWPGLSKDALKQYRQSFGQSKSVRMKLDNVVFEIVAEHAKVKARRSVQFEFKDGSTPERVDNVSIGLSKSGGTWRIDSID